LIAVQTGERYNRCIEGAIILDNTLKTLLANQYEASLCTLNFCVDRCPESSWNAKVANLLFCQAVFHTLIFADYYLGDGDKKAFREQPFHRENREFFADYEEFEDRVQVMCYTKDGIRKYLNHCREKATRKIASETAESLSAPCGFPRRTFSRAELHVYNIRHIQHHAAQLGLRLRLDHAVDIPWVGTGWKEVRG
jgi:hypothetical protein